MRPISPTGRTLLLVGALVATTAGCSASDDGRPRDGGVVLPDGGATDHGTTDGQTGLSCIEIVSCVSSCPAGDQACASTCFARGSPDAQALFQALVTCLNDAAAGPCATVCADTASQACSDCVSQQCAVEVTACHGGPSAGNSGALCGQGTASCADDDICVVFSPGAKAGMCLGRCNALGDSCPTADPAQLSKCAFQVSLGGQAQHVCGWLCEVAGKTFACPNAKDYDCEVFDPQQPAIKYCVPKQ